MTRRDNNKTLYVITGPCGVGKSTISKRISKEMDKCALIEGDNIYHLVVSGNIKPWIDSSFLELFWKNSLDLIENFLENDISVIFNYVISPKSMNRIKDKFKDKNVNLKFIVLLASEETIKKRDAGRRKDYVQGQRAIELLNEFKTYDYDKKYILDTTDMKISEIVSNIINEDRYKVF